MNQVLFSEIQNPTDTSAMHKKFKSASLNQQIALTRPRFSTTWRHPLPKIEQGSSTRLYNNVQPPIIHSMTNLPQQLQLASKFVLPGMPIQMQQTKPKFSTALQYAKPVKYAKLQNIIIPSLFTAEPSLWKKKNSQQDYILDEANGPVEDGCESSVVVKQALNGQNSVDRKTRSNSCEESEIDRIMDDVDQFLCSIINEGRSRRQSYDNDLLFALRQLDRQAIDLQKRVRNQIKKNEKRYLKKEQRVAEAECD